MLQQHSEQDGTTGSIPEPKFGVDMETYARGCERQAWISLPRQGGFLIIDSLTGAAHILQDGWSGRLGRGQARLVCLRGARTALGARVIL
jgi:hypothetical protein